MNDRVLPISTPDEVPGPQRLKKLSSQDRTMVEKISRLLHRDGVIGESNSAMGDPEASFADLYSEAVALGKSEKELNPDYYRPEVEELVFQREEERGDWQNPDVPVEEGSHHLDDEFDAYLTKAQNIMSPRINRGGGQV